MIRILTLLENQAGARKGLISEHGLSFAVDVDGIRILFDCGGSESTVRNGRLLNVTPVSADVLAFSHSHYDHAAGFPFLAEAGLRAKTVIGPHFFEEKYAAGGNGRYSYLGCGFSERELREHSASVTVNEKTVRLTARAALETSFPRICRWETIPERFVKRTKSDLEPDDFEDEQCLVLELKDGLAVVTGCSHPGILNMVTEIRRRYQKPVTAVIGGIHLSGADSGRIERTVRELKAVGTKLMWCNHCSGSKVREIIERDPEITFEHLAAGDCVFLE